MAVKTLIPFEDFADILGGYGLGALIHAEPISAGTVQTNYALATGSGKAVFRYYENRSPQSVLFEVDLICNLYGNGYPCPAPIQNKNGGYIGLYHEKPYVLFEYVEGEHLANPDQQQWSQMIGQVARLHRLTRGYMPVCTEHRLNYNIETCKRLAGERCAAIGTPDSREKLKWYLDQLDRLELPDSLPMGVCHCDFHFTNILFQGGEFKALLDFDDANHTYLLFDLATLVNPFRPPFDWDTWSTFGRDDDVLDFTAAKPVVAEYMKHRQLEGVERRHLFDVLKLSILVDCIWYFERGGAKDFFEKRKLEYLDRLGRDGFTMRLFGE